MNKLSCYGSYSPSEFEDYTALQFAVRKGSIEQVKYFYIHAYYFYFT